MYKVLTPSIITPVHSYGLMEEVGTSMTHIRHWLVKGTLLKMGRYYNTTLCHYWDMSVYCSVVN